MKTPHSAPLFVGTMMLFVFMVAALDSKDESAFYCFCTGFLVLGAILLSVAFAKDNP